MTLEQALKAVTGDRLVAAYNVNYQIKGGDEVMMVVWENNDPKCPKAKIYHYGDKKLYDVNLTDFRFKE